MKVLYRGKIIFIYLISICNKIIILYIFFFIKTILLLLLFKHFNEHSKKIFIPFIWIDGWLDFYASLTPNSCGWFNGIVCMVIFFFFLCVSDGIKANRHVTNCSLRFHISYINKQNYFSVFIFIIISYLNIKYDKISVLRSKYSN